MHTRMHAYTHTRMHITTRLLCWHQWHQAQLDHKWIHADRLLTAKAGVEVKGEINQQLVACSLNVKAPEQGVSTEQLNGFIYNVRFTADSCRAVQG